MDKRYDPEKIAREIPLEPIPGEVRAPYLRPGQLLARQRQFPVAFMPLGTLEWHGRQNPIGVDSLKAERLCIGAAEQCGGVVMPTIHFAVDAHWDYGHGLGYGVDAMAGYKLPGSFYQTDTDLLKRFLVNACGNYLDRGFQLIVMVSGHNPPIQQNLMDEVCYLFKTEDGREPAVFTMDYAVMERDDPRRSSDHAGGIETSLMLHLYPELVHMEANRGHERETLGIGSDMPYEQSSAEEGRIRYERQVAGLVKLATTRLEKIRVNK